MRLIPLLGLPPFAALLITAQIAVAEPTLPLRVTPGGIVLTPSQEKPLSITLRYPESSSGLQELHLCIETHAGCLPLANHSKNEQRKVLENREAITPEVTVIYENLALPSKAKTLIQKSLRGLSQAQSTHSKISAYSSDGTLVAQGQIAIYPGLTRRIEDVPEISKAHFQRPSGKVTKQDTSQPLSKIRPSRSYKTPGGFNGEACTGTEHVFNSYRAFLDCTDAAIAACTQSDPNDKAFCIYESCGNTPDQFEGYWRNLSGDSASTSRSYYKNNFGSSSYGEDRFQVALNPCLYDGAGEFTSNYGAAATVMGESYSLGGAFLSLFHPAKSDNQNLSSGKVRFSFNGQVIASLQRDDFGDTTVPFTFQDEVFKSFPKTAESQNAIYWINKVIPVMMVFRPQGVLGINLEARVTPESRVLEVQFSSYNDFGTSSDAGPGREGVMNQTSSGIVSLLQSQYSTRKFLAMNAGDQAMLPSINEQTSIEYWLPSGGFNPVCGQWFQSQTVHPVQGYQCSTLVNFSALNTRKGSVTSIRSGSDRLVYYRDSSRDDMLVPYPYRSPILDGF